jgi:hypothetical protein
MLDKVVMPGLQQGDLVLGQKGFDFPQFVSAEAVVVGQAHWSQPELGLRPSLADVQVRRFIAIGTEEAEAIAVESQDSGHFIGE